MSNHVHPAMLGLAVVWVAALPAARAATPGPSGGGYTVIADTLDGGGGLSTGGIYENLGSVGQCVVDSSTGGTAVIWHGYIPQLPGPTPAVSNVSPNKGPAAGGQPVTITGTDFDSSPGATVTFGGSLAGGVLVASATQLPCTTGAHPPATVDVAVTNPDAECGVLPGGYTYFADYEADVAPRNTLGDGSVDVTDWVQVGRFAAKLDVPANGLEYQKADCAPKVTSGGGSDIDVTDWTQAGRYAAGLDNLQSADGPTAP